MPQLFLLNTSQVPNAVILPSFSPSNQCTYPFGLSIVLVDITAAATLGALSQQLPPSVPEPVAVSGDTAPVCPRVNHCRGRRMLSAQQSPLCLTPPPPRITSRCWCVHLARTLARYSCTLLNNAADLSFLCFHCALRPLVSSRLCDSLRG